MPSIQGNLYRYFPLAFQIDGLDILPLYCLALLHADDSRAHQNGSRIEGWWETYHFILTATISVKIFPDLCAGAIACIKSTGRLSALVSDDWMVRYQNYDYDSK